MAAFVGTMRRILWNAGNWDIVSGCTFYLKLWVCSTDRHLLVLVLFRGLWKCAVSYWCQYFSIASIVLCTKVLVYMLIITSSPCSEVKFKSAVYFPDYMQSRLAWTLLNTIHMWPISRESSPSRALCIRRYVSAQCLVWVEGSKWGWTFCNISQGPPSSSLILKPIFTAVTSQNFQCTGGFEFISLPYSQSENN